MTDHDPFKKEFDLFISYAHADDRDDLARVTSLVEAIRAEYRRVTGVALLDFFDTKAIRAMDDWEHRILNGLRQSRMMVAVLSPAYFASDYCRKEWEYYIETELAHALPGEGIAPIYIIKDPRFDGDATEEKLKHWVADLKRRQYVEWLDYWPHGAVALEREDAQAKINALTGDIVRRLGRAAILQVNHHVPRPSAYFVGRRDELHQLRTLMIKAHIGAISAVHGIGGIGKSSLAFAYAWGYGCEYPGGRFLIRAEGLSDLTGGMIALAEAKGVPLTDEERQRPSVALAKVRKAFEDGKPALIVIDNLDDPSLLEPHSRVDCLPGGTHVHILATTRIEPEDLPQVGCLALDALAPNDGLALLNQFLTIPDAPQDDEWKAALEIVNRLGGHALALEIAGVFLRMKKGTVSYREFATTLERDGISMIDESVGPRIPKGQRSHKETCIARLLEPTLNMLTDQERRALEYAALLPAEGVPLPWLRDLLLADFPDLPEKGVDYAMTDVFQALARFRLLVSQPSDRPAQSGKSPLARMHRLVQDVVRSRSALDVDDSRQDTITDHLTSRAKWLKAHWGQPGLAWEVAPFPDMLARMIERGEVYAGYLIDQIAVPLLHTGRMDETRRLWAKVATLCKQRYIDAPGNADYARNLSVSYNKLGDLAVSEGDDNAARYYYEDALVIATHLAEGSPGNADYVRDLSISYERLGNVARREGDAKTARHYYEGALAIATHLAERSPGNADYTRILSVNYNKLGDLARSEGDAKAARRNYEGALVIVRRLAEGSPGNADYARELSISYERLGDLAVSDGDAKAAQRYYEDHLAIAKHLADGSPGNADYTRDLTISYMRLGDLARSEGDTKTARRYYEETLAIAKHLADSSPGSANYARDLSGSYIKLGDLAVSEGDAKAARRYYEDALAIVKRLAEGSSGNADYARDLSISYERLGDLVRSEGDAKAARRYYEDALAIVRRLCDRSPGNADYARDLVVSFSRIAMLLEQNGDDDEALDWWLRCWETFVGMKRRGMHVSPLDEQFLKQLEDRFGFGH